MTETRPFDGDDSSWDLADEAMRDSISRFLQVPSGMFADPDLMGRIDPLSLLPAVARTTLSAARRPDRVATAVARGAADMMRAAMSATVRALGGTPAYDPKHARDRRFSDPTWTGNASYWLLRETYLTWATCLLDVVRDAKTSPEVKRKAEFAVQLMIDALAPTNFPIGNPTVLKRAFEYGGLSLVKGARNFARDLLTNGGTPRQVATDVHKVGKNMALSRGKVVLRNDLMELIQYSPSTAGVHQIPLLFSPPWINKYYVMDLSPGRSLVEWAVQHGHTAFMISYRNPDETMSKVRLDDYLLSGPLEALEAISDITGSDKVNLLGLCLGGTLTMATLAYLDAVGVDKINSATFLNTLIDFSEPGLMGVFTDRTAVARLERTMKKTGFLPADNMRRSFDLMRANDLIWNYVVSNWMMGEEPPAFDLLSWNADSTRMPADMHSFYLRSCYLENQLAGGEMELAGQRLDLGTVDQDLYFLAAEQDHIAPWRSSYRGALLPAGDVRFVLSNSGHIAGIVNPPNPKSIHRVVESGAPSTLRGLALTLGRLFWRDLELHHPGICSLNLAPEVATAWNSGSWSGPPAPSTPTDAASKRITPGLTGELSSARSAPSIWTSLSGRWRNLHAGAPGRHRVRCAGRTSPGPRRSADASPASTSGPENASPRYPYWWLVSTPRPRPPPSGCGSPRQPATASRSPARARLSTAHPCGRVDRQDLD